MTAHFPPDPPISRLRRAGPCRMMPRSPGPAATHTPSPAWPSEGPQSVSWMTAQSLSLESEGAKEASPAQPGTQGQPHLPPPTFAVLPCPNLSLALSLCFSHAPDLALYSCIHLINMHLLASCEGQETAENGPESVSAWNSGELWVHYKVAAYRI